MCQNCTLSNAMFQKKEVSNVVISDSSNEQTLVTVLERGTYKLTHLLLVLAQKAKRRRFSSLQQQLRGRKQIDRNVSAVVIP
jgi:hypothetical protein